MRSTGGVHAEDMSKPTKPLHTSKPLYPGHTTTEANMLIRKIVPAANALDPGDALKGVHDDGSDSLAIRLDARVQHG